MAGEKSRSMIHQDLQQARRQAQKLEDAAAAIRRERNRMEECRSDVAQAWKSDSSARFTGKMSAVAEDLGKIEAQLTKTARVIRENAQTIYNAEMEAKRLADIRNHS